MNSGHLSDDQIQQYAMNRSMCDGGVIEHIESCSECAMKVTNYQLMFSALKMQRKPAFDFDLNSLIMERLHEREPRWSPALLLVYSLLTLVAVAAVITGYLFRKNLERIFSGLLPMVIYIMIAIAVGILVFQVVELFRKYQRKMQSLNSL